MIAALALLWLPAQAAAAPGDKPVSIQDATSLIIEGSLRGLTRGAVVTEQVKTIQKNWRRLFNKEPAEIHETPNFLLVGSVPVGVLVAVFSKFNQVGDPVTD